MRRVWLAFLATLVACQQPLKTQVQNAFLQLDTDKDGVVTKLQIMEALMSDAHNHGYNDTQVKQIVKAIQVMTQKHDKNKNGLDFMEMYTASGGKLQDL